ncbi:MAG: DUF1343 domain-containing protein [Odoribacter sp.]|nr:DUF1343 domain-containing protein [Odoribacter sp.]
MKKLLKFIFLLVTLSLSAQVKPGIEVLASQNFDALKGKRVGLITNPTGVDRNLRSTIDILHESPDVKLTALFAPEHGVRGDQYAGLKVSDGRDNATGVKVYSLYGATRRPTASMLADIDVMVYDIQDNGCRSYTFISTLGLCMDACAKAGKEFVVLDRPNPVGGKVEGLITEDDCKSFVSQFPIPYLYGLTPGELAMYLNGEGLLESGNKVNLKVIPLEGWRRSMTYGETGLPWVLPSPHIPTAETSLYYPSSGILGELDYMSIGVGYTLPFKIFAASWIDNAAGLSDRLNALNLPGVKFRPIHFTPFYSFSQGKPVAGVEYYITDHEAATLTLIQFYVAQEVASMYPAHKMLEGRAAARLNMFDKVTGSKKIRTQFGKRHRVEDIQELWMGDTSRFIERSKPYKIYND